MRWVLDGSVLDLKKGHLQCGTKTEQLTSQEADFLRYMGERPGQLVSNGELLEKVWGYHPNSDSRAVSKAVYRIRLKLGEDTSKPKWLHTLRGKGYRFTPPSSPSGLAALPSIPSSPMFGRSDEQDALRRWMASGRRLLTLLGPGGIGKTRLALWAANEAKVAGHLLGFCDLTGIRTMPALWEQLAATLGMKLPDGDPAAAVKRVLVDRSGVLILDNLEGVVDSGAADMIGDWKGDVAVQILATSRQRLGLSDEVILAVKPLGMAAARQLLAARSGWSDNDALTVLAERLDRIPLALELIAAHGPTLPVRIASARSQTLLNRSVVRDGPAHHQTMDTAIGWSWTQLGDAHQIALSRLSVCGGALSLDAAEVVIDTPDALGVLLSLAERSLVRWDGEQVSMFTVIRDFAMAKQLESADTLARLGRYLAEAGLHARDHAGTNRVNQALLRLAAMPTMLTAWRAAVSAKDASLACRLAYLVAEIRFGQLAHHHIRGDLLESLALPGAEPAAAARAQYILGRSAAAAGDFDLASEQFQRAIDYSDHSDEPSFQTLLWCGIALHYQPDRDQLADARKAVEVAVASGKRYASALTILGFALRNQEQHNEAMVVLQQAVRLFSDSGDAGGVAMAIMGISRCAKDHQSNHEVIRRLHELEQQPLARKVGLWMHLGTKYLFVGELDEALFWSKKAVRFHETSGDRIDWMISNNNCGHALLEQGKYQEGLSRIEACHRVALEMQSRHLWTMNGSLATALLLCNQPERALQVMESRPIVEEWEFAWKALVLLTLGEHERAEAEIEKLAYPWFPAILRGDAEAAAQVDPAVGTHARLFVQLCSALPREAP